MIVCGCNQLTYQYPEADAPALIECNVSIEAGQFVLLAGSSGSGKSTFLRALNGLVPRFYGGQISGQVTLDGKELASLSQREIVSRIGFLQQDPERQLLLDSVERELAFGLENLAIAPEQISSRLAEVSHLFGLGSLLFRQTNKLSGGQKQRLALASLLAMYPRMLLLDEPTSQLDPVHAEEVLHIVRRLNEEWGITVVMSEHRLDRCLHLADRMLLFDGGRIVFDGTPREFAAQAREHVAWQLFLPPVTRYLINQDMTAELPLTVKEARLLVRPQTQTISKALDNKEEPSAKRGFFERIAGSWKKKTEDDRIPFMRLQNGRAGYEERSDVLTELNLSIFKQDRIVLFGENGAGKSTLAKVLAGSVPLRKGQLFWQEEEINSHFWLDAYQRIGYLSQNPNDYFLHESVEEELTFSFKRQHHLSEKQLDDRREHLIDMLGLGRYRKRHPHDLSGGERQRLALAIILAAQPQLLIMDEPTRGLDMKQKEKLIDLLQTIPVEAVLMITHDVEFAALYANRIVILYQGRIVADGKPDDVFTHSFYYMPQVYKLLRK